MEKLFHDIEGPLVLPRHRHGLTREAVRTSQSARVLAATADVVAERGYAGASAAAIAKRAGVSSKTFNELVLQRLVARDASSLEELAPAAERLVERVCLAA